MSAAIKEVRWKGTYAEIFTEPIFTTTPKPPLKMVRVVPFEIRMNETTAVSLEPGMTVTFRGRLKFQAGSWGAVGRTLKAQQMHQVSHHQLPGTPLGTYVSSDCSFEIGGREYSSKWGK